MNSTTDLLAVFNQLEKNGTQKKLKLDDCPLRVYCALSFSGNYTLSVMTTIKPKNMDSTNSIKVNQLFENENTYWTNFELVEYSASKVFISLCNDLISCLIGTKDEETAISNLANRYYAWRAMFRKSAPMSEEKIKGLFGELLFLNDYMIPKYGISDAINSWSGPTLTNKDFSIDTDWYEVKTTSVSSSKVKISSITQLSSNNDGILVVVKTEKMSPEYNDGKCCVIDLFNIIMDSITLSKDKENFLIKLSILGFDITNESSNYKYRVNSVDFYLVSDEFPRLKEEDVRYDEISDVQYCLNLDMIKKFRTEW